LSEQEEYRKGLKNINFSRMCSEYREILYGEATIGSKGDKQLFDILIVIQEQLGT